MQQIPLVSSPIDESSSRAFQHDQSLLLAVIVSYEKAAMDLMESSIAVDDVGQIQRPQHSRTTAAAATTDITKSPMKPSKNIFDDLCDDTLSEILIACDFRSAVRFVKCTSTSLRQRVLVPHRRASGDNSYDCQLPARNSRRLDHVWKEIYIRHGFSPVKAGQQPLQCPPSLLSSSPTSVSMIVSSSPPSKSTGLDYMSHCRDRRRLQRNLFQYNKSKPKQTQQCFSLPNRFFYFLPVIPFDTFDEGGGFAEQNFDPPPVLFDCDSFALTSTGTGSELLMLDPFNGSLSILSDCIQHGIASDEAMMEKAMVDAASFIRNRDHFGVSKEWKDEHIAGEIIDANVYHNHSRHEFKTPPNQQLLHPDEDFTLDLAEYFPNHARQRQLRQHYLHNDTAGFDNIAPQEFEMTYVGVDAKPILDLNNKGNIIGSMVGVGRSIVAEGVRGRLDLVCTELCAWFRNEKNVEYGDRRVCRLAMAFNYVDIDPIHKRVFVSFLTNEGPAAANILVDSTLPVPREEQRSRLLVYPLIPYKNVNSHGDTKNYTETSRYFPDPLVIIQCSHCISSFAVDPTGLTLVIATTKGTMEFWEIQENMAHRRRIIDITKTIKKNIREIMFSTRKATEKGTDTTETSLRPSSSPQDWRIRPEIGSMTANEGQSNARPQHEICIEDNNYSNVADDNVNIDFNGPSQQQPPFDVGLLVLQRLPELATLRSPIVSFHVPRHLPLEDSGFVTLQVDQNEGSTLLLWMKDLTVDDFRVASLVNLPLSARRAPRVTFDGSRLIVFGEDHIGLIVLVYQVLSSYEYIDFFDESTKRVAESGGVYNLTYPPRIRFANRIRHTSLGGIEKFDSIHMTTNERLLVLNTKTGDLLGGGGGSPYSEGLLVIDLEDKS